MLRQGLDRSYGRITESRFGDSPIFQRSGHPFKSFLRDRGAKEPGHAARKVVSEIEAEGGTAIAVKADVRNMDRTEAMVRKVTAALGPKGIRVNVVAPGLTETDATSFLSKGEKDGSARMTPLRRIGLPGDVAGAGLFLASAEARVISGGYPPGSGGVPM